MVRCSPRLLSNMLAGRAPVRFSLYTEPGFIKPDEVGAVALWTKDPENLFRIDSLNKIIAQYANGGGGILLNLTVTGLGGSPLEPGIRPWHAILNSIERLLSLGIVAPEGVILRFDPIIELKTISGRTLGNASLSLFDKISSAFAKMGIITVKTSLVDYSYCHVPKRLERLGLKPIVFEPAKISALLTGMREICLAKRMVLDICCLPADLAAKSKSGCIDGRIINRLLHEKGSSGRVTETLHNDIGRQRNTCRCSYSKDIGHSPGTANCYTSGGACLYCYSHRNMRGEAIDKYFSLMAAWDRQPKNILKNEKL